MKSLRNYISEKLIINQQFNEKLIINKNYNDPYTYSPKSFKKLRKIIEDRYDKLGPGTDKNPIDFNEINISNIDILDRLFYATEFEYIDISNWDVLSCENMSYMFFYCMNLKSVGDLSDWNVSNVEDMTQMFYGCNNLKSVGDLSDWNVSKVESMDKMFDNSGITNTPGWYKE